MVMVVVMVTVVLPALISARRHHHHHVVEKPFILQGRVYCDTCRAGFETSATTYIPGIYIYIYIHYSIIYCWLLYIPR